MEDPGRLCRPRSSLDASIILLDAHVKYQNTIDGGDSGHRNEGIMRLSNEDHLMISDLAEALGITTRTIRLYEKL